MLWIIQIWQTHLLCLEMFIFLQTILCYDKQDQASHETMSCWLGLRPIHCSKCRHRQITQRKQIETHANTDRKKLFPSAISVTLEQCIYCSLGFRRWAIIFHFECNTVNITSIAYNAHFVVSDEVDKMMSHILCLFCNFGSGWTISYKLSMRCDVRRSTCKSRMGLIMKTFTELNTHKENMKWHSAMFISFVSPMW